MKKINWEYDIPKLKNIFMIITVIVWVLALCWFGLAVRSFLKFNI